MRMIAAALALLSLGAGPAPEICTYGGRAIEVDKKETYRRLSINAEVVSGGRRRAVTPPTAPVPSLAIANFIDTHVAAKLTASKVAPAPRSTDEEFLRRVSLDLTGIIPDAASVTAFAADTNPDKRARKIDELLASDAFTDRWTMWIGDLVQNVQVANNFVIRAPNRNAYYLALRESIRTDKPYDALVRELLAATGNTNTTGAANYILRQLQPNGPPQDTYDNLAAHSVEKFLGMPALCVSCHDGAGHLELVNWYLRGKKRSDFWKMSAFFARVQPRPVRDPANPNAPVLAFDVFENATTRGYLLNTRDGNKSPRAPEAGQSALVTPAFLTTGETPAANESWRAAYGRMLTADRQFARATVNYLWKEMFGLGLVEPVNGFDLTKLETQPTHPELLEALATELIAKNYSLRAMLRTIANSSAYQLSARYTATPWNEAWVPLFARRYPRRVMAEALLDSIARATGTPLSLPVQGLNRVARAMQLPDPTEGGRAAISGGRVLNQFGRGDRDDVPRSSDTSISQSLAMMNDEFITTRVRRTTPGSTVATLLAATRDPATIADRLYLITLSRMPTSAEREVAIAHLNDGDLGERTEDLQFALLNSLEFLFN